MRLTLGILTGSLILLAGCRVPTTSPGAPATGATVANGAISVREAQEKVRVGASEAEVRRVLGPPYQETSGSSSGADGKHTVREMIYCNRSKGREVARIRLEDDQVRTVEIRTYPVWALDFGSFGSTPQEVKKRLGPPTRMVKKRRNGKLITYWIYTDRVNSEKTLLLDFYPDKRSMGMTIGPNRDDWDNGRID